MNVAAWISDELALHGVAVVRLGDVHLRLTRPQHALVDGEIMIRPDTDTLLEVKVTSEWGARFLVDPLDSVPFTPSWCATHGVAATKQGTVDGNRIGTTLADLLNNLRKLERATNRRQNRCTPAEIRTPRATRKRAA